jgi:hypothetical protein
MICTQQDSHKYQAVHTGQAQIIENVCQALFRQFVFHGSQLAVDKRNGDNL